MIEKHSIQAFLGFKFEDSAIVLFMNIFKLILK